MVEPTTILRRSGRSQGEKQICALDLLSWTCLQGTQWECPVQFGYLSLKLRGEVGLVIQMDRINMRWGMATWGQSVDIG